MNQIFQMPDFEALKALQLYIKHHIEGVMIGMHQSPKTGFGIEFKEYRNYVPGDSLKQLDWKYFARTDHYMIKEAEMEKQHDFIFVLDKSLSMKFEMANASKFNWSRTLIAALAFLANNQHDKYLIYNQDNPPTDFESFLYRLIQLKLEDETSIKDLNPIQQIQNKSTVFIFTDGYSDETEFHSLLKNWAMASEEVMLVHLLFENEEQLDFKGQYFTFKDLEGKGSVQVNTQEGFQDYQKKIESWKSEIQKTCAKNGIAYWQLNGRDSIQKAIFELLNHFNQSWV
ncbi:DUF58 domain-containing protein [Marivirga salinae]|uniref:DUF58 domain-containing protein n=1 Tax=Marivirga salinarum TaxID=3059078 RepID=A0AA51N958_9BACT|nr:DUF58 domain-containing protein [Marivirga sp. BDSF4-3]WMN10977.1 DUF58 domain-containing protein [Marivirga sp. BDSF4-3]